MGGGGCAIAPRTCWRRHEPNKTTSVAAAGAFPWAPPVRVTVGESIHRPSPATGGNAKAGVMLQLAVSWELPMERIDTPTHWNARAAEALAMAEKAGQPETKQALRRVASVYQNLAAKAEKRTTIRLNGHPSEDGALEAGRAPYDSDKTRT
jgi:hypothetical protein